MTYNVLCKDGSGFFTNWEKENIYGDNMKIKDFMCSRCYGRFDINSKRYELILHVINEEDEEEDDDVADFCEDCGQEILIDYR